VNSGIFAKFLHKIKPGTVDWTKHLVPSNGMTPCVISWYSIKLGKHLKISTRVISIHYCSVEHSQCVKLSKYSSNIKLIHETCKMFDQKAEQYKDESLTSVLN